MQSKIIFHTPPKKNIPREGVFDISVFPLGNYKAFSHDVTSAMLVSKNNKTAAMLLFQTGPVEIELFSYLKTFFCSNNFAQLLVTWNGNPPGYAQPPYPGA